jgi:hypothetical protein
VGSIADAAGADFLSRRNGEQREQRGAHDRHGDMGPPARSAARSGAGAAVSRGRRSPGPPSGGYITAHAARCSNLPGNRAARQPSAAVATT